MCFLIRGSFSCVTLQSRNAERQAYGCLSDAASVTASSKYCGFADRNAIILFFPQVISACSSGVSLFCDAVFIGFEFMQNRYYDFLKQENKKLRIGCEVCYSYFCIMKTENKLIAVVGDVHGCIKTFKELYRIIEGFRVPVYSVGDIIDRGKNSKEAVEFVLEKEITMVMGNHERWFLDAMGSDDRIKYFRYWFEVGGAATVKSYFKDLNDLTLDIFMEKMYLNGHYDFLKALPLKIEVNNVLISHAGKVESGDEGSLVYNSGFNYEKIEGKFQVFGHRAKEEVQNEEGWFACIDTGCVYGNKLSGVVVDTINGKIVEVVSVGYRE